MYTELSIFFICAELALVGVLAHLVFTKKSNIDKKSLIYALPVFLLVYAMYMTANVYNGEEITFFVIFNYIHKTLEVFGLEVDLDVLRALSVANPTFAVAAAGACVLSFITTAFSVFVLFGAMIGNYVRKRRLFRDGADVVLGASPDSIEYATTNPRTVLWVDKLERPRYNELIRQGYAVHRSKLNVCAAARCLTGAEHHIVAFRDTGFSYHDLMATFEDMKTCGIDNIYLHVEANVNEIDLVLNKYVAEVSGKANSFVVPFCRYELLARRFVTEHAVSRYVPEDFYNKNRTLKAGKEVNVVFLGFGKVNYELFKQMAVNYQFAREDGDKLVSAPVHYYVFENDKQRFNNEHFVRVLNEHDDIFADSSYAPAEKICDLRAVQPMDANSYEVKKRIRELVKDDAFTCIVISMIDDYRDAAFAHALSDYLGDGGNYKIFVRSKSEDGKLMNRTDGNVVYFGERKDALKREHIINDELMAMSQNVNDLYQKVTGDLPVRLKSWQKLGVIEQYSNISAAANIYFKLGLLGYALKKESNVGITKEELLNSYPDLIMGDKGNSYEYFFRRDTANVLAYIEHARWNAFYIFAGYKPLKKEEFWWQAKEDGTLTYQHKNDKRRRHACLTTYADIGRLIHDKRAAFEEKQREIPNLKFPTVDSLAALYRYDYMVVDGMFDELSRLGYSVVKVR